MSSHRILYGPILPKVRSGWIFPGKQTSVSEKPVCLYFVHEVISKNIRECRFLRAVPRSANLTGGFCTKMNLHMICLDNYIRFFQNNRLIFLHLGLSEQICNSRASLKNNLSGNISYIGNVPDKIS